MNLLKRMFIIILFSLVIIPIITNKTKAIEIGNNVYLERGEKGFFSVQRLQGSRWMYIIHSITKYNDENGNSRIAYCVSPDLTGIGYIDGEFEGYDVTVKELLSDERLWRVFSNGFPYKSAEELGVEYDEDAYLATKQAGFCILRGYSIDYIKENFRAGQDPVEGECLEDIQRRGQKIVDAICSLVDIGYNGVQKPDRDNKISISAVSKVEDDSNGYIYQEFKVTSNTNCKEYRIENIESLPDGSYVSDLNGNKKNEFNGTENFRIMIPKDKIDDDVEGTVKINANCKTYPILYAECSSGEYQNYVLCANEYSYDNIGYANIKVDSKKGKIKIVKIDKDSKKPIQGVKFSIKSNDEKDYGIFETDENGIITIDKVTPGTIQIEEVESNDYYVKNTEVKELKLAYNETKEIVIENELKKASIKIIKIDSNNNEIRIPDVKFEIIDSSGKLIDYLITDENGEAFVENIPINSTYTIREIETNSEYELSNESVTIELKENEIKTLTFKNKRKNEVVKLPRTGQNDTKNGLTLTAIISAIAMFIVKFK